MQSITFIVEVSSAGRSAASRTAQAPGVRYPQSILVPLDGTCLHVVEAPSAMSIGEAATAAAVRFDRIVKAVDVLPAVSTRIAPMRHAA